MPNRDCVVDALLERWMTVASVGAPSDAQIMEFPIDELRGCDGFRPGGINAAHVRLLAESEAGVPPIIVQRDTMRIIDGAHRVHAARLRGRSTISGLLFDGDERQGFLLSLRLNAAHGLPLSLAERKSAAERILLDYPNWSDRSVATMAGISDKTVAAIRRRSGAEIPQSANRIARDGSTIRGSLAEGRIRAADLIRTGPEMSLRDIAAEAGISLTTAKDVRSRVQRGEDPLPGKQRAAVPAACAWKPPPAQPDTTGDLMLERLRRDPAVRLTASGRILLRRLETPALGEEAYCNVLASLPAYHLETVARLARARAAMWLRFAERLELRSRSERAAEVS